MSNIRLFTALKVPQQLTQQIAALPRKGVAEARWTRADDLHITLRFIGDVDVQKAEDIAESLSHVRVKKFGLSVKGLGLFRKPHRGILYAAVESVKAPTHLTAEISDRLRKLNFVISEQFYTPHVTIARTENLSGLEGYVKTHAKKIQAEWHVDSFCLMQSAHADNGVRHFKIIKEFRLL